MQRFGNQKTSPAPHPAHEKSHIPLQEEGGALQAQTSSWRTFQACLASPFPPLASRALRPKLLPSGYRQKCALF